MQNIPLHFFGFLSEFHASVSLLESRAGSTPPPFSNVLQLVTLWLLMSPCGVQCMVFKVGVLGPWKCDPVFPKALPDLAAKLAVERINRDRGLNLGCKVDFVILQEACETPKALRRFAELEGSAQAFLGPLNPGFCKPAAHLGRNWNKAVVSWACVNHELDDPGRGARPAYPAFARALPSPARVLYAVLRHFKWAGVGVVSSSEDLWVDTAGKVAASLRSRGLSVGLVATVGFNSTQTEATLRRIKQAGDIKVIILCMHSLLVGGEHQAPFLLKAQEAGLTAGRYVFVPYDALLYSLPYADATYAALRADAKLRRAYDAVLTVTVASDRTSFSEAYAEARRAGELSASAPDPHRVSPLFGTIYNGIYFVARAMHNSRMAGGWLTGTNAADFSRNLTFDGFNQRIRTDDAGRGLTEYVILDTDGTGAALHRTYLVDPGAGLVRFAGRAIHFPGGYPPAADPGCWFEPHNTCTGGVELTKIILAVLLIFAVTVGGLGLTVFIRRWIQLMNLFKGPSRILLTLDDLTFIDAELSNLKLTLEEISRSRSDFGDNSADGSHSVHSDAAATQDNSNVAIYLGDWVWLKKFKEGQFKEVKTSSTLIFTKMKDLRNENVNQFLGFFADGDMFAVVTEHCSRGSLQDLLRNEDVKLDWMFKSSLLLDLIKGMKYLHNREFPHGRLKSCNCVVDGRFVLKITDYGFSELLETQNFPAEMPPPEELFWTAPELLRKLRISQKGTYEGDVYGFAIVLQEVVLRGPPYCMLDLPAEEIIRKVRRPPPLCRPTVVTDEVPQECLQLMKECWSEQPDRRPTFEEIFDRFKIINKGKKTNIIDSMLRMLEQYSSNLEELIRERTEELEVEKQRTEKLLAEMLPLSVAEALKTGATVEPEFFDEVTIYFSDIVGFATISALSEPIEVVDLLNDLYTLFDAVLSNHDVYKVETIGDAYMVASGLPKRNGNKHAAEIANMSLNLLSSVGTFQIRHIPSVPVRIRIGIHSGSCVAGVVGLTMPRYCLFGDTINTASRMESTALPSRIHVNISTVKILRSLNEGYVINLRGKTELKGKGIVETYWLVGKANFTKPLPKPLDIKPGADWQLMVTNEIKSIFRKANRVVDKPKK